jgi:hypothetical protein
MVNRLGVAVLGLLAGAAACGPDASNDAYLRTTHACLPGVCLEAASPPMTDSGLGSAPLETWPDAGAGPLSGIFATQAVVTAQIAGIDVTLRLLFRLRLLQYGTHIRQSNTLCALKLPSYPGVATLTIPASLQALIQKVSFAEAEGDYLSSPGAFEAKYTPPPFFLLLGAKLKDPMTDPLPMMGDPAGEYDEDGDGHPGVTLLASVASCPTPNLELYVALRTGGSLSATVTGLDTIDGTMNVIEDESVLGYQNGCLSVAANISPKLEPNSEYHAQRLADETELHTSGNVTCADIVATAPMLFGSAWD